MKARIGSSIKGPTTKAKAIIGRSGKAEIAIAKDNGEFLARVVKLKETTFS